jgi:hypothetical protein
MKKAILIIISTVASISFISFNSQSKASSSNKQSATYEKDVREIVWSQLPSRDKKRIKGTWKDAKVSKIVLTKDMAREVKDKSYIGKEVYLIDFPTIFIGRYPINMVVYADEVTCTLIGRGIVD